jgi:RNA-directed DNA polymerase
VDIKPAKQLWLFLAEENKVSTTETKTDSPDSNNQQIEAVLNRENLKNALRKVISNGGSPGIDGMKVSELTPYLKREWPKLREQLLEGKYNPSPVRRVSIPKPGGGIRQLGIPTVLDRFIQQALLQILQQQWDSSFSDSSYGFRPNRNAQQAIRQSQRYVKRRYRWVVDMDLEKFFDQVNHDKLMSEVRKRISDRRIEALIYRYLKAGIQIRDKVYEPVQGTPQGGPLSPLLANLILDQLDRELERRGHRFVRYADDCNVYVRSKRAGRRVLKSISKYIACRLKLQVNETKSAVGRPWERTFLGFSFSSRLNIILSTRSMKRFKDKVRAITYRTRGRRIEHIINELRQYMIGWYGYFKIIEVRSILKELDSWVKRRLRCYLWKQWGRRGYKELRKRGVSRNLAWNTTKSAHGPWRLSRSPALAFALPARYFSKLGLPRLNVKLS